MSVDVTVEQRIERPREEVAGFVMDPVNDTRWILALDSARQLTDGEVGVGTRVEVRLPLEADPDRILPPLLSESRPRQPHWST